MNKMTVDPDLFNYCVEIRRHLHRHPELSFREEKTAEYIMAELGRLGLDGQRVAGTGVYAVIDSGRPGPAVAVRADIDALPVQEENDVPYASTVPGVSHACGHDGHTAILLGLASMLQKYRENIRGMVILLFQPAEESTPGGALPVVESGVLEGVDAILGLHLTTILPTGVVGLRPGPLMASIDSFKVEIIGRGGHGSRPHECIDPIVTGAQLVRSWQGIVSHRVDPLEPVVLTVGTFNAGTAGNVIPQSAVLTGTVRTLSEETRDLVEAEFRRTTEKICEAAGAGVNIGYERGYPVLVNHDKLTGLVGEAAGACPEVNVLQLPQPIMGSEDFAYYGRLCPAAYFFLGAGNTGKGYIHPNHSPRFDFDEEALPAGVRVFLATLERLWNQNGF